VAENLRTQNSSLSDKYFVADIFGTMPDELDTLRVRLASDYVVLMHLVRTPIKMNSKAQIEGDLFQEWEVSNNQKTFKFKVRENQHWSDGTKITAKDIYNSIERQIQIKDATHFDFNLVQKVKLISEQYIEIDLKKKNNNFLLQLAHPEFGVVKTLAGKCDFSITTGPYFLKKHTDGKYFLLANNYYPYHSPTSPKRVVFQSTSYEAQIEGLIKGDTDFVVPAKEVSFQDQSKLESSSHIQTISPKIGFTHWISVNTSKAEFAHIQNREKIISILKKANLNFNKLKPFWEPAEQLYLPDGFGRPSREEISKSWSTLFSKNTKSNLSISQMNIATKINFPFNDAISEAFKKNNIEVVFIYYSSSSELEKIISDRHFDLLVINNDFSSPDLLENLLVTFNKSRPLIFAEQDNGHFHKLLDNARSEDDKEKLYKIVKQIDLDLIEGGYIFPVAYDLKKFYAQKEYNFSQWSPLFPEIAIWKIQ